MQQQTAAFKEETARKQDRLMYLQSRYPSVNVSQQYCTKAMCCYRYLHTQRTKIEELNEVVLTLDYDVQRVSESVAQLKKEGG